MAAAEQKYQEADLEEKLTQLEEAKQRQVIMEVYKTKLFLKIIFPDLFKLNLNSTMGFYSIWHLNLTFSWKERLR